MVGEGGLGEGLVGDSGFKATRHTAIDAPWTTMEPIRLGRIPSGQGTPDRYVLLDSDDGPLLRVDLYRAADECYAFESARIWQQFLVLGWGHRLYLIVFNSRAVSEISLGAYFCDLHAENDSLLVSSAERLFRISLTGAVLWKSRPLGIDGVVVKRVEAGLVHGDGEWDPPGGWRLFRVGLDSGECAS